MRARIFFALTFGVATACGDDMGRFADGGLACDTEGCDDPAPDMFACQDVLDGRGGPMDAAFLDGLADPFARIVLKRPGACPRSLSEMVDKLRLEDDDRCEDDPRAGMLGRVVSERAQWLGKPDIVRAVVSRQCQQRLPYELVYTTPNIDADNPVLPQTDVAVMAFDRSSGVYNFYALQGEGEGAQWVFHGNSFDQIDPATSATSACASCHTDGGLVMREIDEPWLHWESAAVRTIGAGIVIDRFAELGSRSTGRELAGLVQAGNDHWNRTRIAALADPERVDLHGGSTRPLLEPLFCGTAFNLQSAAVPSALGNPKPVEQIPSSFFVDPSFAVADSVRVDPELYAAGLLEAGSRIEGVIGPIDTFFGFTFVERAASDLSYVDRLVESGIVDEEFVLDVLSVDFTAPVYSIARCALLDHAPTFAELDDTVAPPEGATDSRSCCIAHGSAGCEDAQVQSCVCADDDYCCESSWDQACVNAATDGGCGGCSRIEPERRVGAARAPAEASPSPTRLRDAFYGALEGVEGEPASSLRGALAARDQVDAHRERARRFVAACADRASTRDPEGFVRDILLVAAWKRRAAAASSALLDTPGAVATDDLEPPMDLRLDPLRCAL
ncbi:MAG: hypothetical protein ACE37F_29680 [Nannocystaceae bacterium]|nr:hypothetical protein [bacterium]